MINLSIFGPGERDNLSPTYVHQTQLNLAGNITPNNTFRTWDTNAITRISGVSPVIVMDVHAIIGVARSQEFGGDPFTQVGLPAIQALP